MSIARSGTPFQAHSTAVTTVSATLPTGTNVGDLCIVYAFSSLTGAFGATPAGWNVVPNSTQTATAPSCIAYSRVLQSGDTAPTITLQGSASCGFGSFAYSGTSLTDADGVQNNASSTTCTAPSVSPVGAADMLVMIGGGGAKTFSAPTNGLALWLGAASSGSGIADKQLSASGATGSSAMTMSGTAVASSGIQLTLTPTAVTASPSSGWIPMPQILPDLTPGAAMFAMAWHPQSTPSLVPGPSQPENWPFWGLPQIADIRPYTFFRQSPELGQFVDRSQHWPFWNNAEVIEIRPYTFLHQSTELGHAPGLRSEFAFWDLPEVVEIRPYTFLHQSTELGQFIDRAQHWAFWNLPEQIDIRPYTFGHLSAELGVPPVVSPAGFAFWDVPQGQIVIALPPMSSVWVPPPQVPPQNSTLPFWNVPEVNDQRPYTFFQQSTELGVPPVVGMGNWSFWTLPEQLDIRFLEFFTMLINEGVVPATVGGLNDAIVIWRARGGF